MSRLKGKCWYGYFLFIGLVYLAACNDIDGNKPYHTLSVFSPELNQPKPIWVYLPSDYYSTDKHYPVVYMHNAQWLFEIHRNYVQEMHVDETLRALEKEGVPGVIVVGIERNENPYQNEFLYPSIQLGNIKGNARPYLDFISYTLKPYIDSLYRTQPDRIHTAMMGTGKSGLTTIYALSDYKDVFGRGAIFSPDIHLNQDSISHKQLPADSRIFSVVGKNELSDQGTPLASESTHLQQQLLKTVPQENLLFEIHDDGEHKIWYWEREFPRALLYLFN